MRGLASSHAFSTIFNKMYKHAFNISPDTGDMDMNKFMSNLDESINKAKERAVGMGLLHPSKLQHKCTICTHDTGACSTFGSAASFTPVRDVDIRYDTSPVLLSDWSHKNDDVHWKFYKPEKDWTLNYYPKVPYKFMDTVGNVIFKDSKFYYKRYNLKRWVDENLMYHITCYEGMNQRIHQAMMESLGVFDDVAAEVERRAVEREFNPDGPGAQAIFAKWKDPSNLGLSSPLFISTSPPIKWKSCSAIVTKLAPSPYQELKIHTSIKNYLPK